MPSRFEINRRVAFSETDAAGIAHFAQFFRWMEDTEHAFWRSLDFSVHHEDAAGMHGFPRVSVNCDYQRPLRFEDEFTVALRVLEKKARSLTFGFVFHEPNDESAVYARGRMTVVHVLRPTGTEKMQAATLPEKVAAMIEVDGGDGMGGGTGR